MSFATRCLYRLRVNGLSTRSGALQPIRGAKRGAQKSLLDEIPVPTHNCWEKPLQPSERKFRQVRWNDGMQARFLAEQTKARKESPPPSIRSFGFATNLLSKYEVEGEPIGQGSFGAVFICRDQRTQQRYAVKMMRKRRLPSGHLEPAFVRRIQHEVDILAHLSGSLNVAHLHGVYEDGEFVDLVMELCTGGELWEHLQRQEHYTEKAAARVVREVLRAVAQCHAANVIMRDVTPKNFLFASEADDAHLKAIDFGMADYCAPGQFLSAKAGTPFYVAPEVLKQQYSLPADVWSAGVVAYQVLTGHLPFNDEDGAEISQMSTNRDVFRAILYSDIDFVGPPWDVISADAREFVQQLLQRNPDDRPTAAEALQHRWLQDDVPPDQLLSSSIVQRLQRFGTYGRLKQVALRNIARNISADSELITGLREVFQTLDTERRGALPSSSLVQALSGAGFSLSEPEMLQLMAQLTDDADEVGEVRYDDWIAAMVDWHTIQGSQDWAAWIKQAFDAFDGSGSGTINRDDLNAMLCGDVCEVPDMVEAALREADIDADGGLNLQEFEQLLRSNDAGLELFERRLQPVSLIVEQGGAEENGVLQNGVEQNGVQLGNTDQNGSGQHVADQKGVLT
ncbi:hypothetical protein WJX72_003374 [[Myrmecia] bisecta]|uniref:Calcium-dependent protein kinase n=1 Tax=[Myrmecia] bisecta TaxID=41462 RepID=A0AAW1PZN9_9CHLO